jgi:predicted nucleic acid-binding protein
VTGSQTVIDASIALKLVLPNPLRDQCRLVVADLVNEGFELVAPALWACETTSTLCKAVHFGHLAVDEGRQALAHLAALGVRLVAPDPAQNRRVFEWTLHLNRAAAYDSYYLALAEAIGGDLWTADRRLCQAVNRAWVRYVDEGSLAV